MLKKHVINIHLEWIMYFYIMKVLDAGRKTI